MSLQRKGIHIKYLEVWSPHSEFNVRKISKHDNNMFVHRHKVIILIDIPINYRLSVTQYHGLLWLTSVAVNGRIDKIYQITNYVNFVMKIKTQVAP